MRWDTRHVFFTVIANSALATIVPTPLPGNSLEQVLPVSYVGKEFMAAKSKTKSPSSIQPRIRILHGHNIALGPGKVALLQLVAETGAIGEAAKRMEMSYMRAWTLIQTMNESFKEPVVEAARGGSERGGAELTATGRKVLALYQQMEEKSLKAVENSWKELRPLMRD